MTRPRPKDAEVLLLSYEYAAAYLGISVRYMKMLAATGEVPKVPIGARILFDKSDLKEYAARVKREALS